MQLQVSNYSGLLSMKAWGPFHYFIGVHLQCRLKLVNLLG